MKTKTLMLLGLVLVVGLVGGCAEASEDDQYYQAPSQAGQGCGFAEPTSETVNVEDVDVSDDEVLTF